MIELNYRRGIIKIKELWFPDFQVLKEHKEAMQGTKKCDLMLCRQSEVNYEEKGLKKRCTGLNSKFFPKKVLEFTTLLTNLGLSQEDLFDKLSKNYRYEVKRAQKEGIESNIFNANDIKKNKEILNNFILFYKEFAKKKGLAACNTRKIFEFLNGGHLVISVCKDNKNTLAYHVYLHDDDRARLWYSASNYRQSEDPRYKKSEDANYRQSQDANYRQSQDPRYRALVGRANKLLHWNDLLYFKDKGFKYYDWGGYATGGLTDNLEGINKFKSEFGGNMETSYSFSIPISPFGKLFKWAYEKFTRRVCY